MTRAAKLRPVLADTVELPADRVLTLGTRLHGEAMPHADTNLMIFPIPELTTYVSTFAALEPGDDILTGTPGGVAFKRNPPLLMKAGEVKGVAVLRNRIDQEP